MATSRFRKAALNESDPMRVPQTLDTDATPAVQPSRGKMLLLDDEDPGYTTEHVLRTRSGEVRVLSYAVVMMLTVMQMEQNTAHSEQTAQEALAHIIMGHNLKAADGRAREEDALQWLKDSVAAGPSSDEQDWSPSELAQALNEREAVRREDAMKDRSARSAYV